MRPLYNAIVSFCKEISRRTALLWVLLLVVAIFYGNNAIKVLQLWTYPLVLTSKHVDTVQASLIEWEPLFMFKNTLEESMKVKKMLFVQQEYINHEISSRLEQAVDIFSWLWVINDWERIVNEEWYADVIISRAEAIKLLVLIKTLRTPVIFNELLYYDGINPYEDMRRDSWYTPYVTYAYDQERLLWFDRNWLLNPLHPLTYEEYERLVENMWWVVLNNRWKHNKFVTKQYFLEWTVQSFQNQLKPVLILYGNNSSFYKILIKGLIWKTQEEQEKLLEKTLKRISSFDEETLLSQYWFSRLGIVLLIESILE